MTLDLSSLARDIEWREKYIKEEFSRVQSELSNLVPFLKNIKGLRIANRLKKIMHSLTELEKEAIATKTKTKLKHYQIKKLVAYHLKNIL